MAQRRLIARFPNIASHSLWSLLGFVFPPVCVNCRQTGEVYCGDCRATVQYLGADVCSRCGFPQTTNAAGCVLCNDDGIGLDAVRSAALYTGSLRRAVHGLKYKYNRALVHQLGRMLLRAWPAEFPREALLVPVPLSRRRRRERGFNQAELLARFIGRELGLPLRPRGLRRVRDTQPQVGLDAAQRRTNVTGAFVGAARYVHGQVVVLVDDVCTTGATLVACAAALREAGAVHVFGYTLARAGAHIRDDSTQ